MQPKFAPKRALRTVDLALCGLFAAVLALCAWLSIHVLEISFTMQTFGVFLACGLLGGKRATVSTAIYLLLGAVGLPVFTGFNSGLGAILGVTGGYMAGFLAITGTYWVMTAQLGDSFGIRLAAALLGLAAMYALGTVWFQIVYLKYTGAISLAAVLAKCVLPFLVPDLCKLALAMTLTHRLRKYVP